MSLSKEIVDDAELAKIYITNSSMSDDYKKAYIKLIGISTLATNGITPEEKIQRMTEAIQLLAITQGMYMVNIDSKISNAISNANIKQCEKCSAMKHANKVEADKKKQEIIEQWKQANGITDDREQNQPESWSDVLKLMLIKPYIYVVASILAISPYGVEIVRQIINAYCK